jgi:MFS family permease
MRIGLIAFLALLVSVFGTLAGHGLLATLVPIRADVEGFSRFEIGLLGAAQFAGLLVGAIAAPPLVPRLGYMAAHAAAVMLNAGMLLLMPVFDGAVAWILLRFVSGFALAAIYAVVEAYLQASAENRVRGRLLGVYSVVQYAGWAAGGQLIRVAPPEADTAFLVAAGLTLVLGALPVALVPRNPSPGPGTAASPRGRRGLDLAGLYRASPVGFVAALAIGSVNGPLWSLTPLYATEIGFDAVAAGTLVSLMMVGSALFQVPVGRLSDAMDRRVVLLALVVSAAVIEFALAGFGPALGIGWINGVGVLLGGVIATQYYAAAAHTNDRAAPDQVVSLASALLLLYSIGAALGPLTAAVLMEVAGSGALFVHNGLIHAALAGFILVRLLRRAAPSPGEERPGGLTPP